MCPGKKGLSKMLTLYSVSRASSSIVARCFKRIRAETSSSTCDGSSVVVRVLSHFDLMSSTKRDAPHLPRWRRRRRRSNSDNIEFSPFHSLPSISLDPLLKHFLLFSFFFLGGFWLMNFCLVCFLFQDCLAEPEKVGPTPYSRSRTRKFFCAVIRGPVDDEEDAGRRRRRSGARWCTADNKTPLPHHVARTESVGRSSGGHVFPPIYTLLCSTSNALIRPKRADGPRLTTSNEPRPFHSQSSGRAGPSSSSPFLSRLEYIREDTMLL